MAGWNGAAACEEVAVLSTDARYFMLSGDTLEVTDVGNLWWLGIRGVDYVIPTSTLARAALWTDSRVDLETGQLLGRGSALVSLQDLGRQLSSAAALNLSIPGDANVTNRWVNDDPHGRLLSTNEDGDGYVIELARTNLTPERQWQSPTVRLGAGFSCVADDRLFIGGLENRLTPGGDNELVVDTITGAAPSEIPRIFSTVSLGCTVLVGSLDADGDTTSTFESPIRDVAGTLVDLATNEVVTEFRYRTRARGLLFDDGARYLQQDITGTPADGGGYYVGYTGRVRVIDTHTSEILGEAALDGSGPMSHLLCRNEAERVVLSDTGKVHLLDLETLEIIATQPVPFERYFVF